MSLIPAIDKWSIVITGLWNPYIFSPEWIVKNLLETEPEVEPQFEVSVGPGVASRVKILFPDMMFVVPTRERIQFQPISPSESFLTMLEKVAVKTLEVLPHTPISGYGINFGYKSISNNSITLFNASDYSELDKQQLRPTRRQIVRQLRCNAHCVLNLTMTYDSEKNEKDIMCNFHHEAKAGHIEPCSLNQKALEYKKISEEVLENVYGLSLKEDDEDG